MASRAHLQFEDEIVVLLIQWGDVVKNDGDDDIDAVRLVIDNGILIVTAGSLAVLGERVQCLIDQFDVVLVDVVAQETEQTGLRATDGIEKFQCFAHEIVVSFVVVLQSKVVLC